MSYGTAISQEHRFAGDIPPAVEGYTLRDAKVEEAAKLAQKIYQDLYRLTDLVEDLGARDLDQEDARTFCDGWTAFESIHSALDGLVREI